MPSQISRDTADYWEASAINDIIGNAGNEFGLAKSNSPFVIDWNWLFAERKISTTCSRGCH
jgi:hypothetical protein